MGVLGHLSYPSHGVGWGSQRPCVQWHQAPDPRAVQGGHGPGSQTNRGPPHGCRGLGQIT